MPACLLHVATASASQRQSQKELTQAGSVPTHTGHSSLSGRLLYRQHLTAAFLRQQADRRSHTSITASSLLLYYVVSKVKKEGLPISL
jgi:hypothetical protein